MTRKDLLDYINDKLADKTICMGCVVYCDDHFDGTIPEVVYEWPLSSFVGDYGMVLYTIHTDTYNMRARSIKRIQGHPVLIGDMLARVGENLNWPAFFDRVIELVDLRIHPKLPIEKQHIKCIRYVYTTLKTFYQKSLDLETEVVSI